MAESKNVEKRIKSLERRLARANRRIKAQEDQIDKLIDDVSDIVSRTGLLDESGVVRSFTAWWYVTLTTIVVAIVVRICVAVYF